MPDAPRLQPLNPPGPGPSPRLSPDQPLSSFGGGPAAEQATRASQGLAETASSIIQKAKQQADQMNVGDAEVKANEARDKAISQAMQLKGKDAFQSLQVGQEAYQKAAKDIYKNLSNPQQQGAFNRIFEGHTAEITNTLSTYTRQQGLEWDTNTTKARIENYQNQGIASGGEPKTTELAEGQIKAAREDYGKRWGQSPDQIEEETRKDLSVLHGGVIANFLDAGKYDLAKNYFDAHQNQIDPERRKLLLPELRSGAIAQKSVEIEKRLGSTYTLPGGHVDLNKIEADVYALPGFSDQEKQTIASNVKGQAYERIRGNEQVRQAGQESFVNSMIKFKESGGLDGAPGALKDFIPKITTLGGDEKMIAQRTAMANKLWAPGKIDKDDPQTAVALQTQILNGDGDPRASLEKAWNNGEGALSTGTYHKLDKQISDFVIKGPPGEAQQAWKTLTNMANQRFGKDSTDSHDFLYYMYQHSKGKLDTEMLDFAKKEMDRVPKQEFGVWSKVADYNKAKNLPDPGHPIFGQTGQNKAVANAVKSLQAGGKPVTPDMIDWVLKRAPDGKY